MSCAGQPAYDWAAGGIFLCGFNWLQSCLVLTFCEEKPPLTPNGVSFSTCVDSNLLLNWRKKKRSEGSDEYLSGSHSTAREKEGIYLKQLSDWLEEKQLTNKTVFYEIYSCKSRVWLWYFVLKKPDKKKPFSAILCCFFSVGSEMLWGVCWGCFTPPASRWAAGSFLWLPANWLHWRFLIVPCWWLRETGKRSPD